MKETVKYILGWIRCKLHNVNCLGKCYIGRGKIVNRGNFVIGDNVIIRPSCDIYLSRKETSLEIGANTEVGNHSTISAYNCIMIGDSVLTGPGVFIADHNHNYDNPLLPIYMQGVKAKPNACVKIGAGTWIGTNAVIVGSVNIGKNCVIGANSVVTKNIPDYSVAVGSPAKVIRRYDFDSGKWIRC